jgi:lysophospholipase L1-like esterase
LSLTNPPPVLKVKSNLSSKLGLPLVDLSPEARSNGKAIYLEADPVHFNARGNELIARRLFEAVAPLCVRTNL